MANDAMPWNTVPLNTFNKSLVEVDVEDAVERGDPCYLCGLPQAEVLVWTPSQTLCERLELGESWHLFRPLPLCASCIDLHDQPERVELIYNRALDLDDATRAEGWDLFVSNHAAHLVTPERVAVSLEPDLILAYSHPPGRPDITIGISAAGEIIVDAPDDAEIPRPPVHILVTAAAIRQAQARRRKTKRKS